MPLGTGVLPAGGQDALSSFPGSPACWAPAGLCSCDQCLRINASKCALHTRVHVHGLCANLHKPPPPAGSEVHCGLSLPHQGLWVSKASETSAGQTGLCFLCVSETRHGAEDTGRHAFSWAALCFPCTPLELLEKRSGQASNVRVPRRHAELRPWPPSFLPLRRPYRGGDHRARGRGGLALGPRSRP